MKFSEIRHIDRGDPFTTKMSAGLQHGFTLIEMMISIVIGLFVTGALVSMVLSATNTTRTSDKLSEVQENARFAMRQLQYDIRMAGNIGRSYTRSPIKVTASGLAPSINNNCFTSPFDWAMAIVPSIAGESTPMIYGQANISGSTAFSGCITASDVVANTDILSLHYVDPAPIASTDLENGKIYIYGGLGGGVLFQCGTDGDACLSAVTDRTTYSSGTTLHRIVSRLYYVRTWSAVNGDGIPTLVRVNLAANGNVVTEPLVEGIVALKFSYGLDLTNDGVVNGVMDDSASALEGLTGSITIQQLLSSWSKVKTVRISLLSRSMTYDGVSGTGSTNHNLAGINFPVEDKYLVKEFHATVSDRNPSARTVN